MLDALKTISKTSCSEDGKQIEEVWKQRLKKINLLKLELLRISKYEHDKATMVEAIDNLVSRLS